MIDTDYYQILKWVLIVLTAGFIGQFGKSLATYLIQKTRQRKKTTESSDRSSGPVRKQGQEEPMPPILADPEEAKDKARKKASKALVKMKKKEAK